ncbi:MAG TPA: response regulator [Anaerolineales bacterium]|nr:response regulator [Anaerolineales bacterium]
MTSLSKTDFANQIRLALLNLHDFASLQKLPITGRLSAPNGTLDQGVRSLRAEILDAIEQLNPSGSSSSRAKERRPYALLYGRYVQGMTTAELAEELAISVRQLRREHARALNAVTELLWEKLSGQLDGVSDDQVLPLASGPSDAAQAETEQLISQARMDDLVLADLVNGVLATLAPVAAGRSLTLVARLAGDLPLVRANRVVLRQGVMGLLSHVLQHFVNGQVTIESNLEHGVTLRVTAAGKYQAGDPGSLGLDVSRKLISSLGGSIGIKDGPKRWQAEINLPVAEDLPILIMDDNLGLIELFRRYLAGHGYQILDAHSADEAFEAARKLSLKLVILDVMMPEQDGWEILQRLKTAPETKSVPVLICSVLNEPEIAFTLGASDYLPKPVTQDDLLAKVERWCRSPSLPEVPPPGSPAGISKSPSG